MANEPSRSWKGKLEPAVVAEPVVERNVVKGCHGGIRDRGKVLRDQLRERFGVAIVLGTERGEGDDDRVAATDALGPAPGADVVDDQKVEGSGQKQGRAREQGSAAPSEETPTHRPDSDQGSGEQDQAEEACDDEAKCPLEMCNRQGGGADQQREEPARFRPPGSVQSLRPPASLEGQIGRAS